MDVTSCSDTEVNGFRNVCHNLNERQSRIRDWIISCYSCTCIKKWTHLFWLNFQIICMNREVFLGPDLQIVVCDPVSYIPKVKYFRSRRSETEIVNSAVNSPQVGQHPNNRAGRRSLIWMLTESLHRSFSVFMIISCRFGCRKSQSNRGYIEWVSKIMADRVHCKLAEQRGSPSAWARTLSAHVGKVLR